jgi:hypothetical protein
MSEKKPRTRKEIIEEMTGMIAAHLATIPPDEREARISAFEAVLLGGEEAANTAPAVRQASGKRRSSRRNST